ncbi:MAG: redox-regulated ATPase YchF [Clostridiales bacterium]|nr:redox-regulated ATPase YchF [Clostridiales bacterium]
MKIGLIGLPATGKTTFFQLLTEVSAASSNKAGANIGMANIPDDRIDFLSKIYNPKKTTYAAVEVIDIQGIQPTDTAGKSSSLHFLEAVRQVDALVHVVRAFRDDTIFHTEGSIDPLRDIETVNLELLFADLAIIENRIHRIETGKKITAENRQELELIKRCKECLEKEQPLFNMDLTDEEEQILRTYNFLTERPLILLVNMDDEQFASGEYYRKDEVDQYAQERNIPIVEVSAKTELEISNLEEEDRTLFMEEMGIEETGVGKLAKAAYDLLGLISFITVGEDEVRAWPIKAGTIARDAAGKVHTDIARGFIRAEVARFQDFKTHGSMQKLKEQGLARLEGKEAIVEDGDIINFRFNV